MQDYIKKVEVLLSNSDVKKEGFILYCLCVELLDIVKTLIKPDK